MQELVEKRKYTDISIGELSVAVNLLFSEITAGTDDEVCNISLLKQMKRTCVATDALFESSIVDHISNFIGGDAKDEDESEEFLFMWLFARLEYKSYTKSLLKLMSCSNPIWINDYFKTDERMNIFLKEMHLKMLGLDGETRPKCIEKVFEAVVMAVCQNVDPEYISKFPNTTMMAFELIDHIKTTEIYPHLINKTFKRNDESLNRFIRYLIRCKYDSAIKQTFEMLSSCYHHYDQSTNTILKYAYDYNFVDLLSIFDKETDLIPFLRHIQNKHLKDDEKKHILKAVCQIYREDRYPKIIKHIGTILNSLEDRNDFLEHAFNDEKMIQSVTKYVDYIIDEVDKKGGIEMLSNCCHSENPSKDHSLLISVLRKTFYLKQDERYSKIYKSACISMIKGHGYQGDTIAMCIENDASLESSIKTELQENIDKVIEEFPALKPWRLRYQWAWAKSAPWENLLTCFYVIVSFMDTGFDIKLAVNYYYWQNTLRDYICSNNGTTESMSCIIHSLDKNIPFGISFGILVLTHILQYALLYFFWNYFEDVMSYFLGCCCSRKLKRMRETRKSQYWSVIAIVGLFLPFASYLYLAISMPLQMYKFEKNKKKFDKLNQLSCKQAYKYPTFPERRNDHDCPYCDECDACLCRFCGFVGTRINALNNEGKITRVSTISMDNYNSVLSEEKSKLADLNGMNRMIVTAFEDTYILLLQMYIILPLTTFTSESSPETLIVTWLSIFSGIWSQATSATHLHFSRRKKIYMGKKLWPKYIYLISMVCQIAARLTMAVVFGYTNSPNAKYTPLFLMALCIIHILLSFVIKLLVQCWTLSRPQLQKSNDTLEEKKEFVKTHDKINVNESGRCVQFFSRTRNHTTNKV